MSEEISDEEELAIRKLGQFVLNRGTSEFRDDLYEFLVGAIFVNDGISTHSEDEIVTGIETLLGISGVPISPVRNAIKSLLDKSELLRIGVEGKSKYRVSEDKLVELHSANSSFAQTQKAVEEQLVDMAREKLGEVSQSTRVKLIKTMTYTLALVSKSNSNIMTTEGIPRSKGFLESTRKQTLTEFIQEAAIEFFTQKKSTVVAEIIEMYFDAPTEELESYLHSLWGAYHIFQVLHLDPECQCFSAKEIAKISIYLDTNVIINALVGPKPFHGAIIHLLSMLKTLGIKVYFTKRTRREFLHVVRKSRVLANRINVTPSRYEKTESSLEYGFLKDYLDRRAKTPTLTISGYFGKWQHIQGILKTKFGIVYDDDDCTTTYRQAGYNELFQFMEDNQLLKPLPLIEHDTCHILLIQSKRTQEEVGILGPRVWFLTVDYDLAIRERWFWNAREVQSCIHPDSLTQILLPVLSPDTRNQDVSHFVSALFRSRLPEAASLISEEVYAAVCGPWMDSDELTSQDIRSVIGTEHVMSYLEMPSLEKVKPDKFEKVIEEPLAALREQKARKKEEQERERRNKQVLGTTVGVLIILFNMIGCGVLISLTTLEIVAILYGAILVGQVVLLELLKEQIQHRFGFEVKKGL